MESMEFFPFFSNTQVQEKVLHFFSCRKSCTVSHKSNYRKKASMEMILEIITGFRQILEESAIYVLFGLFISGLLKTLIHPGTVAAHFGKGRFGSVFKAAILGIPIPLCSCGVLPAAVSMRKQGANTGATTAFLISTPESGVDSISISYALLDPFLTVIRPVAAFFTALCAGIAENLFVKAGNEKEAEPDLSCTIDGCCTGIGCPEDVHKKHHSFYEKIQAGVKYGFTELWNDMALWFFAGVFLASLITTFLPEEIMSAFLGEGIFPLFAMLVLGIPIYICATASTPIAAALIAQGVSPGAALVFLLSGPATNITSLTVLFGVLGKRAGLIYLAAVALFSLGFGWLTEVFYTVFSIPVNVLVTSHSEILPEWLRQGTALFLVVLSAGPVFHGLKHKRKTGEPGEEITGQSTSSCSCTHCH